MPTPEVEIDRQKTPYIHNLVLTADGRCAATTHDDNKVLIWELPMTK
jgi:hypothetical protein